MYRKKILSMVSVLLIAGLVSSGLTACQSSEEQTKTASETTADKDVQTETDSEEAQSDVQEADAAEAKGDTEEERAKSLIGKVVSREELKQGVGEWTKFEKDHPSCDRSMETGRFFYEGFSVLAKSYDDGETYTITAVNE